MIYTIFNLKITKQYTMNFVSSSMFLSLELWFFAGMYTMGLPIMSLCRSTLALSEYFSISSLLSPNSATPYSTRHLFVFMIA